MMGSGEQESVFFKSVAPDRSTTLQLMPHTSEYMGSINWSWWVLEEEVKDGEEEEEEIGEEEEEEDHDTKFGVVGHEDRILEKVDRGRSGVRQVFAAMPSLELRRLSAIWICSNTLPIPGSPVL